MCRAVVTPVSDAPYEVIRASFREKSVARVQAMGSHDWTLDELSVRAAKYDIFALGFHFPHGGIEVAEFSSILLVQARSDTMCW